MILLVNKMSQISTTSISPAPSPDYSTHPLTSENPSQRLARIKTGDYLLYDLYTNSFQYSARYYSHILSSSGRLRDPVLPVSTPADFMYPLPNNPKGLLKILENPSKRKLCKECAATDSNELLLQWWQSSLDGKHPDPKRRLGSSSWCYMGTW